MKTKFSFSECLYVFIFSGLIIMFFTIPIVQFGTEFLDELFNYAGINLPTLSNQSWSLYDIQNIVGDVKPILSVIDNPSAHTSLTILSVIQILYWLIPILFGVAVVFYLLRCKGCSKFIGFFAILINFIMVGKFCLIPLFSSQLTTTEESLVHAVFQITDLAYVYLVVLFIGFILLFVAKPKKDN